MHELQRADYQSMACLGRPRARHWVLSLAIMLTSAACGGAGAATKTTGSTTCETTAACFSAASGSGVPSTLLLPVPTEARFKGGEFASGSGTPWGFELEFADDQTKVAFLEEIAKPVFHYLCTKGSSVDSNLVTPGGRSVCLTSAGSEDLVAFEADDVQYQIAITHAAMAGAGAAPMLVALVDDLRPTSTNQ